MRVFNVEWLQTKTTSCLILAASAEEAREIATADENVPDDWRWFWDECNPEIDQLYPVADEVLAKLSPHEVVMAASGEMNLAKALLAISEPGAPEPGTAAYRKEIEAAGQIPLLPSPGAGPKKGAA